MKIEILFRGKLKKSNKFIYGLPTYDFSYIFNSSQVDSCDNYEVIPETIGQFTGLLDKNGTKIFEGDIVNIKSGEEYMYIREIDKNCIVKFSYGSFNPVDIDEVHYDFGNIDEFEVIGNIYDNSELLKL